MAIVSFCLPAFAGLMLTGFVLARLRKRRKATAHQYALIMAIGMSVTWLVSFFAPLLSKNFRIPSEGVAILGIALASSAGVFSYGAVRLYFLLRKHAERSIR